MLFDFKMVFLIFSQFRFMSFPELLKKNILPIIIVIGVVIVWFLFAQKPGNTKKQTHSRPQKNEIEYANSGNSTDSLAQFGMMANENFVIRADAEVRRTPNLANYNTLYKLKFGTKVYTKNTDPKSNIKINADSLMQKEIRNGFVAVYSQKPLTLSDIPVGYMALEDIIEKSEFKNYSPEEKVPTLLIPDDVKAVIESHLTIDGVTYKFIEDESRFNNSLCYGDFNDDTTTDFAVILDKTDNSGSILLIYGLQRRNKYELIYQKTHPTLMRIKTIAKNTKTNVNYEVTSFAVDGIHITNKERGTFFQVFDLNDKSFMVFKN